MMILMIRQDNWVILICPAGLSNLWNWAFRHWWITEPICPIDPTFSGNTPKYTGFWLLQKANALSNLSGFMNKQSGGAVARGTLGSPEFLQPLVDREFPIGEPAVLEVRIAGSAPLTVQWYHNSQPVRESIEKDIRLLQKGTIEFHLSSTRDSRTRAEGSSCQIPELLLLNYRCIIWSIEWRGS